MHPGARINETTSLTESTSPTCLACSLPQLKFTQILAVIPIGIEDLTHRVLEQERIELRPGENLERTLSVRAVLPGGGFLKQYDRTMTRNVL